MGKVPLEPYQAHQMQFLSLRRTRTPPCPARRCAPSATPRRAGAPRRSAGWGKPRSLGIGGHSLEKVTTKAQKGEEKARRRNKGPTKGTRRQQKAQKGQQKAQHRPAKGRKKRNTGTTRPTKGPNTATKGTARPANGRKRPTKARKAQAHAQQGKLKAQQGLTRINTCLKNCHKMHEHA